MTRQATLPDKLTIDVYYTEILGQVSGHRSNEIVSYHLSVLDVLFVKPDVVYPFSIKLPRLKLT